METMRLHHFHSESDTIVNRLCFGTTGDGTVDVRGCVCLWVDRQYTDMFVAATSTSGQVFRGSICTNFRNHLHEAGIRITKPYVGAILNPVHPSATCHVSNLR